MSQFNLENDDFRNHLYNQSKDGKRLWIYPGRIIGQFYRYRSYFSYFLLVTLFGLPWVEVKGQPIFLFNVLERKFIFWGVPFFPQDFHLVALGLVAFLIFISLFTVLFGRIWCGWACPQTIFMEMLFRKIEYWIEGDDKAQRRLDESPWTQEKIIKKGLKHVLFLVLAFAISNTFLMYLVGKADWLKLIQEPVEQHIAGFSSIWIFTGVFYFVFARFREMVCMVVCPYGRLQGVLLDNNSILVQYDHKRGEPRGKINAEHAQGDCIDCHWCVRVCPTGIDIRNGSNQLECIGCTACIDACDAVMDKIHKPQKLIRYDSLNGVNSGTQLKFNLRIGAYSAILVIILGFLAYLLGTRKPFETTLFRTPGMTYQFDEKTKTVRNLYQIEILNKSMEDEHFEISVEKPLAIVWVGNPIHGIERGKMMKGEFFIQAPLGVRKNGEKLPVHIRDREGEEEIIKTSFIQPDEK
jgi:cytochrome c oxidase accessory protein FixG